jgi:UDP-2,3-diacylglucosamine pyrophosphatase LpxH
MSDIHLGEDGCLFNDKNILNEFKNNISLEAKCGTVDELIILGDLFDLSLASYEKVYEKAGEFFKEIEEIENLNNIVFVPGNHDHHMWTSIIEDEQIIKKIKNGNIPAKNLQRVDLTYGEKENTFLSGFLKGSSKKLLVTYPNLFRDAGGILYFMHHGHLLDRIFTPANTVIKPESLQELEAFNASWIEGIWYHLGQAERLGEMVNKGYKEFLGMKTIIENYLEKFQIKGKTVSTRLRGMKTDSLTYEISEYLDDSIGWYKNTLFTPMSFIFGHTHKKSEGNVLNIKSRDIKIYNTGAWHGDISLASYILIDGNKEPELKHL